VGQKQRTVIRVVLDTNVLVSALLFSGEIGNVVSSWKARKFLPVFRRIRLMSSDVSSPTLNFH